MICVGCFRGEDILYAALLCSAVLYFGQSCVTLTFHESCQNRSLGFTVGPLL